MRIRFNKYVSLAMLALLAPAMVQAADAATAPAGNKFNAILIGLVSLTLILLFAVLVLGNTLRQLGYVYRDKMRAERKGGLVKSVALLIGLGLTSIAANAEEAAAVSSAPAYISGIPASDFYTLMGIIALELLVIISMVFLIRTMVRLISADPEKAAVAEKVVKVNFWDRFNKVVPIEKEADIMLDHDYDGIKELDNSLPPWWKYGFYLTIVTGVIYLWYYHAGGNGPSSYDEFVAEVQAGEEAKAAYLAKSANNVDENTVKMLDAAGIAAGGVLFEQMCAACHAKDGGGGVGPNLCDEYWLHGGSVQDIFKTIKYGWPDKGMKSWKDDYSPNQIAQITSYVKSLQGSKPAAPKDKQGELFIEGGAAPADSASTVADTAKAVAMK
ncbi:MAG: c-type cytochrome [Flavipsychrobacter sp.]|nr:c-type cytochrome [Flavipsychrobacter sp.]